MTVADPLPQSPTTGGARLGRQTVARSQQLPLLVVMTARRTGWSSVAGCLVTALVVVWLITSREAATDGQSIAVLRWSAVLLAGAVANVLDDPTEDDLAGAATPVWWRRLIGFLVVGVPVAAAWGLSLTLPGGELPWAALTLEAAALVLLGAAVASTRRARRTGVPAGIVAAAPPAAVLAGANLLPERFALMVAPADEVAWHAAHLRWGGLAAVAAVALAVAARDRARRSPLHLVRPAVPRPANSSSATTDPVGVAPAASPATSPTTTPRPRPSNDRRETRSEAT